jgi:hypothetical protein
VKNNRPLARRQAPAPPPPEPPPGSKPPPKYLIEDYAPPEDADFRRPPYFGEREPVAWVITREEKVVIPALAQATPYNLGQLFEHYLPRHLTVKQIGEMLRKALLPNPRRRRKSDPAMVILRELYPPDGRPSASVQDWEIEAAYHKKCDDCGTPLGKRIGRTQLMRCVGRKKS